MGCQAEILCATLNGLHCGRGSVSHTVPFGVNDKANNFQNLFLLLACFYDLNMEYTL